MTTRPESQLPRMQGATNGGDTTFGSPLTSIPGSSPIKPTMAERATLNIKAAKTTSERHELEKAHPINEEEDAKGYALSQNVILRVVSYPTHSAHRELMRLKTPIDPPSQSLSGTISSILFKCFAPILTPYGRNKGV